MAGSIIQKDNNKYLLRYMYNGKRYNKTITAESYKKATKMLNEFIYEIEHNEHEDKSSIYFNDFTQLWYNKYVEKNLSDRTQVYYKDLLVKINTYFNGFSLSEVKRIDIINFLDTLTEKYAKPSIDKYKKCLITIFNYAIKCEMIQYNPATLITTPNGKEYHKKENVYSLEQVNLLLKTLEKEDNKKYVVMIALMCGLRRQEVLALNKEDIDFNKNIISINKAIVYDRVQQYKIGKTKTIGSNRIVYIPQELAMHLKEFPDGRLFNYSPDHISRWFHEFIKENNLPPLTFHGLRHTHATMLINNNVDYKTVSAILGHSQTSTTMNIYVHKNNMNIINAGKLFDNIGTELALISQKH